MNQASDGKGADPQSDAPGGGAGGKQEQDERGPDKSPMEDPGSPGGTGGTGGTNNEQDG